MTLAGTEFTTIANAQSETGVTTDDAYLERIVRSIDAQMRQYLGIPYMHSTTATLQPVRVLSPRELCVIPANGPLPVTSITAVKLNGVTLTLTDFAIQNASMGIVRYDGVLYSTSDGLANIEQDPYPGLEDESSLATGYVMSWAGGWVMPGQTGTRNFPYDLEDAGLQWVNWRYRKKAVDVSIASESLMSYSVSYFATARSGLDIPDPVKAILDRYRVVAQA